MLQIKDSTYSIKFSKIMINFVILLNNLNAFYVEDTQVGPCATVKYKVYAVQKNKNILHSKNSFYYLKISLEDFTVHVHTVSEFHMLRMWTCFVLAVLYPLMHERIHESVQHTCCFEYALC